MKWELIEPYAGAMIRVKVGAVYHYGIFVSDDEIIQFGPNPSLRMGIPDSELSVCVTDVDTFLCGQFLETAVAADRAERKKMRKPEQVVKQARSRIGEKGYSILYNNCEHFANECLTGEKFSAQTDGVRAMFRNMNVVDLYVAKIPEGEIGKVVPQMRQEQIENTGHEGLRRQRYYVWKLLEYGLQRSLGLKMEKLHFSRTEQGKWSCQECFFSLSHSEDAVAVAVSKKPVGVDIECLERPISLKIGGKILTEAERKQAEATPPEKIAEFLLTKWSAKESLFKASDRTGFRAADWETDQGVKTQLLQLGDKTYCCSVASPDVHKLRIYDNIQLS